MDQIIIELIGDASGLKPAEEALRSLSKVSRENMEAFNKANEAALKFAAGAATAARASKEHADSAQSTSRALDSIGSAANKSITAVSGLNAAIAAGAVRAATSDLQTYAQEIAAFATKKKAMVQAGTQAQQEEERAGLASYMTGVAAKLKGEDQLIKKAKDAAKSRSEMEQQLASEAIKLAEQVSDAIFANEAQRRQNQLTNTIDNLNAQRNAELLNTTLTASQRAAIERKYKEEEAQAKLKAWKADQKAKEEQAIINGLLAFTMSMAQQGYPAGLVTGLLALASAGVQAAIIASKTPPKFAKGVISIEGPGTETSDSIAAYLSRGESVITAERTRQYKPILEQIHAGTYQPLPVPMLSTLPRLNDVGELSAAAISLPFGEGRGGLDYDKLGSAVAKNIPPPVINNIQLNEKGFSKHIIRKGNKVEYYNDRMKF